jgi:hypothetical protein
MTLRFFEGFENKEPAGRAGMTWAVGAPQYVAGRSSGSAVRSSGTTAAQMYVTMDSGTGTLVLSAAVRLDAITGTSITGLLAFYNAGGNSMARLDILASTGQIQIMPNSGTSVVTPYAMSVNEWSRIDLKCAIANTGGWIEAWVNGVKVGETLNVDTIANFGDVVTSGRINLGATNTTRVTMDDVYILDTTGPAPYNNRLGDIRIETLVPNGPGARVGTQFVPSTGIADNSWQLIDEMPASDADYVTAPIPDDWEAFALTDLVATYGKVLAVQPHYRAWKTDSGSAFLKPVLNTYNVGTKFGTDLGLGTLPQYLAGDIFTEADAGIPWTIAGINALEMGVQAK